MSHLYFLEKLVNLMHSFQSVIVAMLWDYNNNEDRYVGSVCSAIEMNKSPFGASDSVPTTFFPNTVGTVCGSFD